MGKLLFILLIIFFLLGYLNTPIVLAQDTFGPTCEKGAVCTPTPAPTLPVTGPMDTTFSLLGLGGFMILAGSSGVASFYLVRRSI